MKVSHRITRLAAAGLIAGALAAPAAARGPRPPDRQRRRPVVIEPEPRPSCRASTTASTGPPPPSAPAPPAASSCSSAPAAPPTATATSTSASRTNRDPARPARPPRPSFGGRAGEHPAPSSRARPTGVVTADAGIARDSVDTGKITARNRAVAGAGANRRTTPLTKFRLARRTCSP